MSDSAEVAPSMMVWWFKTLLQFPKLSALGEDVIADLKLAEEFLAVKHMIIEEEGLHWITFSILMKQLSIIYASLEGLTFERNNNMT